eukprot:12985379-Ditylum_brightwellii.AAC.1
MLTPYETLQLAAYLQLGGGGGDNIVGGGGDNDQNVKHSKNFKQRNAVVQKVMESLGLWNVRHRTIGDRTHAATGGGGAGAKNKGKMESKRGGGAGSG